MAWIEVWPAFPFIALFSPRRSESSLSAQVNMWLHGNLRLISRHLNKYNIHVSRAARKGMCCKSLGFVRSFHDYIKCTVLLIST